MKLAVAGGTGTVGRHVVEIARERGHEAVVLSRSHGVDLVAGTGPDGLLDGVEAVIDVTSAAASKASDSIAFFEAVTRNLAAAERRSSVGHHVALSIVGIDVGGEAFGYYAGKVAQERAVAAGPVPWTILRATQFHEFAPMAFRRGRRGPFVLIPAMRSQPVAAREVAARLVELAEGAPAGRARDLGGPRVERMSELSRRWGEAARLPGRVVEVPLPGGFGRQLRNGSLLAGPDADLGVQTFTEWLAEETGVSASEPRVAPPATGIAVLFGGSGGGGSRGGAGGLLRPRVLGPRVPEPSLTNAAELVEQLRGAGMRIELVVEGTPRRLPVAVDEAAFRALQEGASVVLMRTRDADATARVRYLPSAVEVEVEHGPGALSPQADRVVGLVKTRGLVQGLGGATVAGPTADGGFRVTATLPSS